MKKFYHSKTIWVAILTGAIGIVVALETQFPAIGWIVVAKAVLDVFLRLISTTEIV